MKIIKIVLFLSVLSVIVLGGTLSSVYAATSPAIGTASTYAILSNTYTNTVPGTTINGDIGFTTGPAVTPGGVHANYGSSAPYATAGIDQNSALSALAAQTCTFTFAPGAINLATDTTHGAIGVYTPGVYCISGAASIGTAGITLSGNGVFIFRITDALDTVVNSNVTLASGASSCNVWWTPIGATTLGATSTFKGNVIDAAGITLGSDTTWEGRALAFGGTVTTANDDTITAPGVCSTPGSGGSGGTVIGGYIMPQISILKAPNPSSLSNGPGNVLYTYTVTNPGIVDLDTVSVTDDKCSTVSYISGDINGDAKLGVKETWIYRCSALLNQTTLNVATAVGHAYGRTATDTATATVSVTMPINTTIPKLPNTGFGPDNSTRNTIAIAFGIIASLSLGYIAKKKFSRI